METASVLGASLGLPAASRASLRRERIGFGGGRREWAAVTSSLEKGGAATGGGSNGKKVGVPNSNYVVPLDMAAAGLTRPLNEILRDLNKRVPDKIINPDNSIPWYHANRMLSFYAPGISMVKDFLYNLCKAGVERSVMSSSLMMKVLLWCIVLLYEDQMERHTVNPQAQLLPMIADMKTLLLLQKK